MELCPRLKSEDILCLLVCRTFLDKVVRPSHHPVDFAQCRIYKVPYDDQVTFVIVLTIFTKFIIKLKRRCDNNKISFIELKLISFPLLTKFCCENVVSSHTAYAP